MDSQHRMRKEQWTWKEGFLFALAKEFRLQNGSLLSYEMSRIEKWSSSFLQPSYLLIKTVSKYIRKPVVIGVVTLFAGLLCGIVFYNFSALVIFGRLFPYQTVRFALFIYLEMNLLSFGCRAFARFNNETLVGLWKKHRPISVLPGEF